MGGGSSHNVDLVTNDLKAKADSYQADGLSRDEIVEKLLADFRELLTNLPEKSSAKKEGDQIPLVTFKARVRDESLGMCRIFII